MIIYLITFMYDIYIYIICINKGIYINNCLRIPHKQQGLQLIILSTVLRHVSIAFKKILIFNIYYI
jgi:hypothetical protein